jgi:phage terminase large subunit
MRDFLQIMEQHRYFKEDRWNKTDFIYAFETGSKIEFFSVDQPSKVRGPRRDRLFINEANNVPFEAFDQLEVRTKEYVYLDWNPTTEFWFYDRVLKRDDVDHLIITYRDNEALDQAIVRSIEQRKGNKAWWQVYGEGQLGEIETRIYTDWRIIETVPVEARLERYGLDFGYTNDETAIVAIYYLNGEFIWDEIAYQKGLSNKMIADVLLQQPKARVIADSAEPKSIGELKSYKLSVAPAHKGPGSVLQGIQNVQSQWISVTKRSINIIKEYRNYVWITDKDGRILNEPVDIYNHAMDAGRYAMEDLRPRKPVVISAPPVQSAVQPYYPELGI